MARRPLPREPTWAILGMQEFSRVIVDAGQLAEWTKKTFLASSNFREILIELFGLEGRVPIVLRKVL